MPDMTHISPVATGFIVRKILHGRTYQKFFGTSKHGTRAAALEKAQEFRDELLATFSDNPIRFQRENARNTTGVVGVSWFLRKNQARIEGYIHSFRAQAPVSDDGESRSRSYSVCTHGLWKAYRKVVQWRSETLFGQKMSSDKIAASFIEFLDHYAEQAQHKSGVELTMMIEALTEVCEPGHAPRPVREKAEKILAELDYAPAKPTRKKTSSTTDVQKIREGHDDFLKAWLG